MVGEGCWSGKVLFSAIASFYSRSFNRNNKHDTFSRVISTGYLYVLFLWAIPVLDFCPMEIYINLGLPLSTITFTVNSHANNHCYKYIYLFQMLYSMKSVFFIKIKTKFFYNQILFKCETPVLFFHKRTMAYSKKLFIGKTFFCRISKNIWITCCSQMTSHAIWVDQITGVMISTKKINKNESIL